MTKPEAPSPEPGPWGVNPEGEVRDRQGRVIGRVVQIPGGVWEARGRPPQGELLGTAQDPQEAAAVVWAWAPL